MKLGAGSLSFGSAVIFYSIELISSQGKTNRPVHTKLENLFPHSNGSHFPPIQEVEDDDVEFLPNFHELNGHTQYRPAVRFLKRGDFVFAYKEFNQILLLSTLFSESLYIYPVFDTKNYKWYTLSLGELQQLGVGRFLPYVRALEAAHATEHEPNYRVNSEAHNAAKQVAYSRTRKYEATLVRNLFKVDEGLVNSVKEHYLRAYNKEYERHAGGSSRGRSEVQKII